MKKYLALFILTISFILSGCSSSKQPKKPPFKYTVVKDISEVVIYKRNDKDILVSAIFTKKDFKEKSQRERFHTMIMELNKYLKSQNITNYYLNTPKQILKNAGGRIKVKPFMLTKADDILDYCYPPENSGLEKDKCFIGDQHMSLNISVSEQDFFRPTLTVNEKLSSSIKTKLVLPKTKNEMAQKLYHKRVDR